MASLRFGTSSAPRFALFGPGSRSALLIFCIAVPARAGDLFDDVEGVAAELHAAEAPRRREAVDKLEPYRNDEARPHLLLALGDADLEVRVRAARALGRRHMSDV